MERDAALLARAQELARRAFGERAELRDPLLLRRGERNSVWRCEVALDGSPLRTLVLKHMGADEGRGFDEWAGLQFLSSTPGLQKIAPAWLGGCAESRVLLMEHVAGPSLDELLAGDDPAAVRRALESLAATMARLVAGSLGREREHEQQRAALPGQRANSRRHAVQRWQRGLAALDPWLRAGGLRPPRELELVCSLVATAYAEPRELLAFSHGDPAPSNNRFADGDARLLDFEYAGYRHALWDLSGWAVLCPLPEALLDALVERFRGALAGHSPALADDDRFAREWASIRCFRALAMLPWFASELLAADAPWQGEWTKRSTLVSTLLRLEEAAGSFAPLGPLAELGGALAVWLQARWPGLGDARPSWPALR